MRPRRRHRGEETGAASAELVLATPVLLVCVLLVVQFGLWLHASHVATAAAQEGSRAVRLEGGTAAAGERVARDFLAAAGSQVVESPDVTAVRDPDAARVEVSGHAVGVVPGFRLPVRASSAGPVERFRAPNEP